MIRKLIAAFWFGSAFFLMLAASAAFRVAPDATTAADVVGAMLTRWHYIALAAPLILFILELRNVRPVVLALLFAGLILATAQGFIDLRIRTLRWTAPSAISSMQFDNPVRREFRALHGVSMSLLLLQGLIAAFVVVAHPAPAEERDDPDEVPRPVAAGATPDSNGESAPAGDEAATLATAAEATIAEPHEPAR